ncbi:class I SAM-dependent methyltransferase [Actinomadura sp. GC306]|uniref:class I SAM-dependent methyltransferase n=1 Tax=Actinomadura sp. GC306 TaxID=2530367 RepID=UPI00104C5855|nr:class I SAM-dependent methyltransferase [Actinomadura sp. GC306]TDC70950.1 class I SAM-dependent methyltransferase [Actinomadura sp. GC306]
MSETTAWQEWQDSWDRQQEWYMPDREERFRVLLDMVEALAGAEPNVLDLACGTGSITARLLRRFPKARVTGVDLDPALLAIARGTFDGDDRVTLVTADLTDPSWSDALPGRPYDAVVTATALHWLDADPLRALYGRVRELLRDGGVFLNADHMTDDSAPRITAAALDLHAARRERELAEGALDWRAWWTKLADDPVLAEPARRRFEIFGDPRGPARPAADPSERPTDVRWHLDALREQGFAEARQVWCSHSDALVAALR